MPSLCQSFSDMQIESQSLYSNDVIWEYTSKLVKHGGYKNIKKPDECNKDCEHCYVDDDVCEWVEYQPGNWLWDYIKYQAIIRFFEIWGSRPRSSRKIYDGLGVDQNRESSVAGILGILNQSGYVEKDINGDWIYKGTIPDKKQYKSIKPLKPTSIVICQQVANQATKHISLSAEKKKEE
jgi:hypothetical protein